MRKTCGNAADWACIRRGYKSTNKTRTKSPIKILWKCVQLFSKNLHNNQHQIPQLETRILPLSEQIFYPVSTTPIINTTKLIFKKDII